MSPESLIFVLAAELTSYHAGRIPIHLRHESETDRVVRIAMVARQAVEACQANPWKGWPLEGCVALLATTAKWESGLLESVHSGEKRGPAGEVCLVQLHRFVTAVPNAKYRVTAEDLAATTGLDEGSTRRCLDAGVKTLGYHVERCLIRFEDGGRWAAAMVFEQYHHPGVFCGKGATPMSVMSMDRAGSYVSLLRKLKGGVRRLEAKP